MPPPADMVEPLVAGPLTAALKISDCAGCA